MMQKTDAAVVKVNGVDCLVGARLTFKQIAMLAGRPVDTVTYRRGPIFNLQGILMPGESVPTKPGMIITATATGSA
jgi:hypothetical protein